MNVAKTVLVVDDALFITAVIEKNLTAIGYEVLIAHSAEEAMEILKTHVPDLILLDVVMPGMSGFDMCRILRKNPRYNMIPIIMITGQSQEEDRLKGLELGADDYIVKPFVNRELIARVNNTLTRLERVRNLNPLSWLQGNIEINNEIERRIESGGLYAIMYVDLNEFKAYNDVYGFSHGDDLIRRTAEILTGTVESYGASGDFVGHIGGDDFVVIGDPDGMKAMAEAIIDRFEKEKMSFYNEIDRVRGYTNTTSRHGKTERVPLVGIALAVLISSGERIADPRELGEVAADLKGRVKRLKKSTYLIAEE